MTGNVELALLGDTRAVGGSNGGSTVSGATVDIGEVGEVWLRVTDGDVDDAVVGKEGDGSKVSGLLSTVLGRSRGESRSVLAYEGTSSPETTSAVKEGGNLGWGTTVTSGCAQKETVKGGQVLGGDDGVAGLERVASVHLLEDRGVESLGDLEWLDDGTCGLGTLDDLLGEGRDVAVHRVEDDADDGPSGTAGLASGLGRGGSLGRPGVSRCLGKRKAGKVDPEEGEEGDSGGRPGKEKVTPKSSKAVSTTTSTANSHV